MTETEKTVVHLVPASDLARRPGGASVLALCGLWLADGLGTPTAVLTSDVNAATCPNCIKEFSA